MKLEYESLGYYMLEQANPTDTGYDLKALETTTFSPGECKAVDTGIKLKIDKEKFLPVVNFKKTLVGEDAKVAWLDKVEVTRAESNFGIDLQVRGRSSMALKGFVTHFGTIDDTYHSPVKVVLHYLPTDPRNSLQKLVNLLSLGLFFPPTPYTINRGDKIAQLVVSTSIPVDLVTVMNLEEDRGGFGTSGV